MRRRSLATAAGLALALLVVAAPGGSQGFDAVAFNSSATNVTLTTTSETSIIASGPATLTRPTATVCVFGWAQLTTGTGTTTVTPRIRRGTTASGTLVSEANAVTIGAAAGSTEQYVAMVCEARTGVATVDYNLTLTQAGASGNGTALQAGILVLVQ